MATIPMIQIQDESNIHVVRANGEMGKREGTQEPFEMGVSELN